MLLKVDVDGLDIDDVGFRSTMDPTMGALFAISNYGWKWMKRNKALRQS